MIRKTWGVLVLGVSLFWSTVCHGGEFSMSLQGIKVVELSRLVFSEILHRNYYLDADFVALPDEVTLDVRGLSKDQALSLLMLMIGRLGYAVEDVDGVAVFSKKKVEAPELDLFAYRLRYRSLSYVEGLLAPLFDRSRFGSRTGAVVQGAVAVAPAVATAAPSLAGAPSPIAGQYGTASVTGATVAPVLPGGGALATDGLPEMFFFRGTEKEIAKLKVLLPQVDIAPGEVIVKAVVYEVNTSGTTASAVSLAASLLGGRVSGAVSGPSPLPNTISFSALGISAIISALSSDSRFKVVSAPTLRVRSGSSARFAVGDEVPVLGAVSYQQNGGAVQSVDYRSSGVIFDLKPVVRDAAVDLTIFQQLSSFAQTQTGVNGSPTLSKRELTTSISVQAGDVVVLGGLDDVRDSSAVSGFSWLPQWLRSKTVAQQKSEILLVLDLQRI